MDNCDSVIKDFLACQSSGDVDKFIKCTIKDDETVCNFNGNDCTMSDDNKEALNKLPECVEYVDTNESDDKNTICVNKDTEYDKC